MKAALVNGQAGVNVLLPVAKELKLAREVVKVIIATKNYTRQKIVFKKAVLVTGQAGVDALFHVVKAFKPGREHVKEQTVRKIFMKISIVGFNRA